MSGAVGTGAALGENFFKIQEIVMEELDLRAELPSTQIVGRDRYISLISTLSNIAASMEKFATEIRNLQRSEIGEVAEPFAKAGWLIHNAPQEKSHTMRTDMRAFKSYTLKSYRCLGKRHTVA